MLILDQLRTWRGRDTGTDPTWLAAWDRTIDILGPVWPTRDLGWDGKWLAEGAAALATGVYIVAKRDDLDVGDVHRPQIEELAGSRDSRHELVGDWERELTALGHDLSDPADPVAEIWRMLSYDHTPSPEESRRIPDAIWEDSTMMRLGSTLADTLPRVLGQRWNLTF
ncbi:hypothetical protein [Streptacidiphilus sp. MAP5-52]|uniref:hypothetical protein n=1 Tax=Streptacidiphilus sp. MAP5-52 TaxID=3156267 RepID=UPI003517FA9B